MDFTRFAFADWQDIALVQYPEALVAALISAVATIVMIKGFSPTRTSSQLEGPVGVGEEDHNTCEFLIEGNSLRAMSEPARALLAELNAGKPRLAALKEHLQEDCPSIQRDVEALVFDGTRFRHHCPKPDGTAVEIVGEPHGNAAFLSIRPASDEARALRDAQQSMETMETEIRRLNAVLDQAPILAWRQDASDQVIWANKPYYDRFDITDAVMPAHRVTNAFSHVLEEVPLTPRNTEVRRRVAASGSGESEPRWFEISEHAEPDGESMGFALETDELVAAESSLRRFVETLTETFAHLPIGLAVFDKNRRLGLFNPALTELVKIDAVWLAGRPSLRDFLERLREIRQMPEQKDFASWRRKLGELEQGAREGTYEENWVLPSGKVFRVTGRPHPQGALAFLFEDISTAIMLERKYRSELELSQSTLDRLNEAVAVFDASGRLAIVNTAFEELWNLKQSENLVGPEITGLTELWSEKCKPSEIWSRITEFTTSADARSKWLDVVETNEGELLEVVVAPLPDASALVVFRKMQSVLEAPLTDIRDTTLSDLALESLRGPVEKAMATVVSAIPRAQNPETFKQLNVAVQDLKHGLDQSRQLHSISQNSDTGTPLRILKSALARRDIHLSIPGDAASWGSDMLRVATALALAAADHAPANSTVELKDRVAGTRLHLTVICPTGQNETPPAFSRSTLVRRIVEQAAGTASIEVTGGRLSISASLPLAVRNLQNDGTTRALPA